MTHDDDRETLRRRLERERHARREAETIAERATSELYETVEKLAQLNNDLEEANRSIKEFVAIASHDLGSPLTSLIGFTQLLIERAEDEDHRSYLEIMLRQGGQMRRLVDDLLLLSKLDAGAIVPQPVDIVVVSELERTVAQLGDDARSVMVEVDPGVVVHADPDHVQRILTNYLTNAIKYGAPPVVAEAASGRAFVELRVRDQGPGVPSDFVNRLFARFARAEADATQAKGTGLGLSIVRGLAIANGGDVWYEPNDPGGSCFGVRLPKAS
jgi:signal transduction histidine kinase